MTEILDGYVEEIRDAIQTETSKAAKDTAQRLRSTSARKTGEYREGWRSKRTTQSGAVTYNAKMPGLTHLLEKGHLIVNKKGTFGRVPGDHKIADAEQWGADEFERRLLRRIQ